MLHITNGDSAVTVLRAAGVRGEILPWRDVLHEGPVRAGLDPEALSAERAQFIAEAGWAPLADVRIFFRERDRVLRSAARHDEVILWFEHDLYDQLQLIQVLDGLYGMPRVSLVCEAEYLGTMAPERAAELFELRSPVTKRHYNEARAAWAAFRSTDPSSVGFDYPGLPFLGAAMKRLMQEYPWSTDGLSRLERAIVQAGDVSLAELFERTREEPAFLGDTVLKWRAEILGRKEPRWLGGVLIDRHCAWRWNPGAGMVKKKT